MKEFDADESSSSSSEDEVVSKFGGGKLLKDKEAKLAKKRARVDRKADIDAALSRLPHAHVAAAKYEAEGKAPGEAKLDLPGLAGSKRGRAVSISSDSDSDNEEAYSKKYSRFSEKRDETGEGVEAKPRSKRKPKLRTATPSEKADFVRLPPGSKFLPLPYTDPKWRSTIYVAGKSGSGKSEFSSDYLTRYKKLYPERTIYGVCKTKLAKDPAYEKLGIKQVPVSLFLGKVDLEKTFGKQPCMILFDDWDSMEGMERKAIQDVIQDILNVGRKMGLSCVVTSHLLTDFNKTRGIINEADNVVVFPRAVMSQALTYFCTKLGVPRHIIPRLQAKGEWVMIHNSAPLYVLSETEAEMLK